MCRDAFRKNDDDYSDEEESLASELDEETYTTYDETVDKQKSRKKTNESEAVDHHKRRGASHQKRDDEAKPPQAKYEDDGTLETVDTTDRAKEEREMPHNQPLGLSPPPVLLEPVVPASLPVRAPAELEDNEPNPAAPIKELEYDDRLDHGADVSVMESLGGPSLLIEKQRAAAQAALRVSQTVPEELIHSFGLDYPTKYGMTREQYIQSDPMMFYTYVVKKLLEQNEPEKVRLLDKLLAKYKGREDHLVQKLSVRYSRPPEEERTDENDEAAFTDAVKKSKASSNAAATVNLAKDRLHGNTPKTESQGRIDQQWPEKEHKEADIGDGEDPEDVGVEDEQSESSSEYSRDSVDGTSPAVIAQVSELLNYVYGKTSVPGQIDRVSTIMRAYEGREAVLLELLETKALIKANKEKENADNLPSFLRNSHLAQAQKNAEELEACDLPPVTPMAQPQNGTVLNDDISSMSGVSSPAAEHDIVSKNSMVS